MSQNVVAAVRKFWPPTTLALLVALAYWPGRGGGYAFDDFPNIVNNTALHVLTLNWDAWLAAMFSSEAGTLQRPLAMVTFAANYYFTGLDPVPMKLTNIAIHALNALLVLGLVRILLAAGFPALQRRRLEWAARFTAAAWALHPINLMAVLFVVQRMESLSHTLVFGGLLLYLLGRKRQLEGKRGWMLIAPGIVGGTVLGVLAKESAVLLPLYAALVELCLLRCRDASGCPDRRLLGGFVFVLVIPALFAIAWLLPASLSPGAYANRDFSLDQRLMTESRVVLDYMHWTLAPSLRHLSLYHDDFVVSRGMLAPWSTLPALLGIAALLALAVWMRPRRPLLSLGVLWFLGAQVLTATFIPLELVFEHRNYFASLGICLALTDLLLLMPLQESLRRLGALLAVAWLLALGMTTHLRAYEWADPLRFAATEAAKHPASPRATYAYGNALLVASGYRRDSPYLEQARSAFEHARTLPRSGILPHSALLLLAARTGQPLQNAWWAQMQARLQVDPIGVQEATAVAGLVRCAREQRCAFPPEHMLETFSAGLSQGPNAEIINLKADYTINVLHQPMAALALWQQAIALKPREPQYRINLVKLLIAMNRIEDAREQVRVLRHMGRYGQYGSIASELESRMQGPT